MIRLLALIRYCAALFADIARGSLAVARWAFSPSARTSPSIVRFPLRCRNDLELTVMTSSITITPGTQVLAVAGTARDDDPYVVFVHSLFGQDRQRVVAALAGQEDRVLAVTRGGRETRGTRRPDAKEPR